MDEEKTVPLHKGRQEEVAREVGHQRSSDVGLPLSNNPPQPQEKGDGASLSHILSQTRKKTSLHNSKHVWPLFTLVQPDLIQLDVF